MTAGSQRKTVLLNQLEVTEKTDLIRTNVVQHEGSRQLLQRNRKSPQAELLCAVGRKRDRAE